MTPAMTGSMISPSTSSRSIEPAPPPCAVSDCRPSNRSTTCANSPAISEAAVVDQDGADHVEV